MSTTYFRIKRLLTSRASHRKPQGPRVVCPPPTSYFNFIGQSLHTQKNTHAAHKSCMDNCRIQSQRAPTFSDARAVQSTNNIHITLKAREHLCSVRSTGRTPAQSRHQTACPQSSDRPVDDPVTSRQRWWSAPGDQWCWIYWCLTTSSKPVGTILQECKLHVYRYVQCTSTCA